MSYRSRPAASPPRAEPQAVYSTDRHRSRKNVAMPGLRQGKPFDWLEKPGVRDAVLSHASCRKVARLAGVSHQVVSSYRKRVVAPALVAATKAEQFDALMGNDTPGTAVEPTAEAIARAAPMLKRIFKRYQRFDEYIDRCGQDWRMFTSLVNAERSFMEFEAKLTGLYADAMPDGATMPCNIVQLTVNVQPQPSEQPVTITLDPADIRTSSSER